MCSNCQMLKDSTKFLNTFILFAQRQLTIDKYFKICLQRFQILIDMSEPTHRLDDNHEMQLKAWKKKLASGP